MASLEQLAEDSNIAPLAPPDLDPEQLEIPEEGPFVYEFDVEVRPEFDLPDYKGLKLSSRSTSSPTPTSPRSSAGCSSRTARWSRRRANVKVEPNDIIVCDLVTVDGGKELNKATEVRVRVEKQLALTDGVAENFAKQIVGAKAGDIRDVDIKLAETVADQSLKGKTVKGRFTIKDIKTIRLPELTPDLLEQFGVNTEAQLQELIATSLERHLEYQQRQYARQQVLQQVAAEGEVGPAARPAHPPGHADAAARVMEMRTAGMTDQQIESRLTVLRQDVLQSTAVSLKEHFVLQKIAETEKIEIEDDDIDAEIERIAAQSGESFRKVKAQMEKEDLIEALATELLERKALDLILNNAEYEEVRDQAGGAGGRGGDGRGPGRPRRDGRADGRREPKQPAE